MKPLVLKFLIYTLIKIITETKFTRENILLAEAMQEYSPLLDFLSGLDLENQGPTINEIEYQLKRNWYSFIGESIFE